MHEARLCLSIIRLAEQALEREGGRSILRVELEVGEFSGVAPEALEAAFPICARGTPAEGATLLWRATPGRGLLLRALEVT
jgi:hydrogenase nickel incorporation protein HypA/HybF